MQTICNLIKSRAGKKQSRDFRTENLSVVSIEEIEQNSLQPNLI